MREEQCKKKKRKPPRFNNKVYYTISKKRNLLKHFTQIPTAVNKTRLLKISQKANLIARGTKCDQLSNNFPKCMIKPKMFFETPFEMTGRRSVKTKLNFINEKNTP